MTGIDIKTAAYWLRKGEVVGIPTETVYGLAADATNENAIKKIFEVKKRPSFDPLIVHVGSADMVETIADNLPDMFYLLAEKYCPGPITFVLNKKPHISGLITAGLDTVAIRIPAHPLTQKLLQEIDFPLVAPSANPFGYVSPTEAIHVEKQLGEKIPYILDGGRCGIGLESTIVNLTSVPPAILRNGAIDFAELKQVIPSIITAPAIREENPIAPGMLKSHYAPSVPVVIGDIPSLIKQYKNKKVGVLSYRTDYRDLGFEGPQLILSSEGNLNEAAKNLYASLRNLDISEISIIISEFVPDYGIGVAINDRLRKASNQNK